jgi:leucyl aminopeptidase
LKTATLVVPVGEGRKLGNAAKAVDEPAAAPSAPCSSAATWPASRPEPAAAQPAQPQGRARAAGGRGKDEELGDRAWRKIIAGVPACSRPGRQRCGAGPGRNRRQARDSYGKTRLLAETLVDGTYVFDRSRARKPNRAP